MSSDELAPGDVRDALERILASQSFRDAQRSSKLLRYIVEQTLAGKSQHLKEYTLGVEALERGATFDPRTDPIARVEASRLRARLAQYYADTGRTDAVVIALPKGGYIPSFSRRAADSAELRETGHAESGARSSAAPAATLEGAGHSDQLTGRYRRFGALHWMTFVALAILMAGAMVVLSVRTPEPPRGEPMARPLQVEIHLGADDAVLASDVSNDISLDRAGRQLIFLARKSDGANYLFSRRLADLHAHELPGTQNARMPFLSPDGRWVAFWKQGALVRTRTDGTGQPEKLATASDVLGGSWGEDGTLIVSTSPWELTRIDPASGKASLVLAAKEPGLRIMWPQSLENGSIVLYTADRGQMGSSTIEAADTRTGKTTQLVTGGTYARYVSTGHLLYASNGTLFAVRFDLKGLRTVGEPVPVVRNLAHSTTFGYAQYAAAENGMLVYRRGGDGNRSVPAWIDATQAAPLTFGPGAFLWPRLSPDGTRLALTLRESADYDIWVYDFGLQRSHRLIDLPQDLQSPVWTPDGERIIYGTRSDIRWASLDHASAGSLLEPNDDMRGLIPWSVSPDGSRLSYFARGPESAFDLWTVPLQSSAAGIQAGKPELFRRTPTFEVHASFSPDGHWLAFASNESGQWEAYVRSFPDDGRQVQVSRNGGRLPMWSGESKTLFYQNGPQIMAVDFEVRDGSFVPRAPRLWTSQQLADTGVIANYDVARDATRVLGLIPAETPPQASGLVLISNFVDLLEGDRAR